ncbi:hypothetical protein CKM354_001206500 [Cercospora kikuchii]|uniref:Uncharacterized protein n=1 Tax=Cercospora kikuchii TaxID=84275 RepID=A0A9P3CU61_9PEZI|nr:uncharacterized protein CKM354_001206500 [Cercospora kikuchii]GIZ49024.1 hypothetical protein CKM354_001206500 [Cercospora kikuchii]
MLEDTIQQLAENARASLPSASRPAAIDGKTSTTAGDANPMTAGTSERLQLESETESEDTAMEYIEIRLATYKQLPRTILVASPLPPAVIFSVQNTCRSIVKKDPISKLTRAMSTYRCAAVEIKNGHAVWTLNDPRYFACRSCTNARRACFRFINHNQYQYWLVLPLHETMWPDPTFDYKNADFFIVPEDQPLSNRRNNIYSERAKAQDFNGYV